MKRVGIITFHTSYNYGAFLQAKATEESIKKVGASPVFINYTNSEEKKQRKILKYTKNLSVKENLKNFLGAIYIGIFRKEFINGKRNFEHVISMLPKTSKIEDKNKVKEEFEIFLSGSDQIWNPDIFNGKIDSMYFGDIGIKVKKIAYASSMGSYRPDVSNLKIIAEYLNEYEAIGVREEYVKELIDTTLNLPVKVVLDPTLLLNSKEWIDLFPKEEKYAWLKPNSYILLYFVAGYKDKKEYIEYLREKYKEKKIIWIKLDNRNNIGVDCVITDATPYEFIRLIKNAYLIITDSFHGTAFSVNFQKNFVSSVNVGNPERVKNLLSKLGLDERIVIKKEQLNILEEQIDYKQVSQLLNEMREESLLWLKQAINGEEL